MHVSKPSWVWCQFFFSETNMVIKLKSDEWGYLILNNRRSGEIKAFIQNLFWRERPIKRQQGEWTHGLCALNDDGGAKADSLYCWYIFYAL